MTYTNGAPAAARNHRRQNSWRTAALVPVLVFVLGGCSELLEVDLPGAVQAGDLTDPGLAETLALSVQADFECGLVDQLWWPGLWFDEFLNSSQSRPNALMELRAQLVDVYADPCNSGTGPIWTTLQLPRIQGENLREIMDGYDPADPRNPPDPAWLRAGAFFYEAYGIQLLAEAHCAVTFDAGPLVTRAEAYTEAKSRFTSAMGHLANVTADNAADAANMMTAALIGRARSNLYLGDVAGVLADAALVPLDFEYFATYDKTPSRRRNKIVSRNTLGTGLMPHREFLNLTVRAADGELTMSDGVADPRVETVDDDPGEVGGRGLIQYRFQLKYTEEDDGIPFASGREALLMIAEVDPTQSVAIINTLRSDPTGLYSGIDDSAWPLPAYAGGTAAEIAATLREERRRELWMQGQQQGDKLRWLGLARPSGLQTVSQQLAGTPAVTAFEPISEYGTPRNTLTCLSIPVLERTSNLNLTDADTGR